MLEFKFSCVGLFLIPMFVFTHPSFLQHQHERYYEVAVRGDLAEADIQRAAALQTTFEVKIILG